MAAALDGGWRLGSVNNGGGDSIGSGGAGGVGVTDVNPSVSAIVHAMYRKMTTELKLVIPKLLVRVCGVESRLERQVSMYARTRLYCTVEDCARPRECVLALSCDIMKLAGIVCFATGEQNAASQSDVELDDFWCMFDIHVEQRLQRCLPSVVLTVRLTVERKVSLFARDS
jgi:hypothetical protein